MNHSKYISFKLIEEQRLAYILKTVLDFSYKEITYILEIEESQVKARLHRARQNLLKYFKNQCKWLYPKNNCSCNSKIGFALSFAPEILKRVRKNASIDNDKIIAQNLKKISALNSFFQRLPLFVIRQKSIRLKLNDLEGHSAVLAKRKPRTSNMEDGSSKSR